MLAIVVAFKEEVKDYLKRGKFRVVAREDSLRFYYQSQLTPDVVVVEGGAGKQRAVDATEQLIERYNPELLVSAGFAGGVQAGVNTGDLFICDRLMSIEGPAPFWQADSVQERSPGDANMVDDLITTDNENTHQEFAFGGCMSVPELVSGSSMKEWIGATFPVSIIDMESYWVSETASAHGIPHVVVRSVLDPLGQTLPAFVGKAVDDKGNRSWGRVVNYLAMNPTDTPKLIHLANQVKIARASLGGLLTRLSPKAALS